ncbi:hypothetical protein [Moorella sp. Hama-1]|uniref:hypothetical protein n=1 Tax=Moorella sp. Hama-1 TaxID=2138101 RepID=UPI0019133A80|nr:hypothetical protein [Moorella sp. Hama-1]BCV20685.1 hypothetical protein hamaS1_07540 [Moorella sp. Hama-1]
MSIEHDRLFKGLLTTFFREFMELFFPAAHALIDYTDTWPLVDILAIGTVEKEVALDVKGTKNLTARASSDTILV